jgi:hypothetical protein
MMPLAAHRFGIWAVVFKLSRYVSLASIVAAFALPVVVIGLLFLGSCMVGRTSILLRRRLLVILRHRENIGRLVAGTENRFGTPKPAAEPGNRPTRRRRSDEYSSRRNHRRWKLGHSVGAAAAGERTASDVGATMKLISRR